MRFSKGVSAWVFQALLALAMALPAQADELAEVNTQLQAGRYEEALAAADAFLRQHPRDAQMRFLKAVILGEQNRTEDAILAYSRLIEDFPEMPEPYNNLAVLLAASGQYDKARSAFETATRIQPSYAAAHENLGNIYAKMAIRSYGRALQLNPANAGAKLKVSALHGLIENSRPDLSRQVAAAGSVPLNTASVQPAPAEVSKPAPAIEPSDSAGYQEILNVLDSWIKAWNAKDVKSYLGFYAANFQTPEGEPRKKWEFKRRARILDKAYIRVTIGTPRVTIKDDGATVRFMQNYASDRFTDESAKILTFAKQGGKWRIVQESTES